MYNSPVEKWITHEKREVMNRQMWIIKVDNNGFNEQKA